MFSWRCDLHLPCYVIYGNAAVIIISQRKCGIGHMAQPLPQQWGPAMLHERGMFIPPLVSRCS
eukprot:scaffold274680_cov46-Prasinocladus_malaysianus.AAC.4